MCRKVAGHTVHGDVIRNVHLSRKRQNEHLLATYSYRGRRHRGTECRTPPARF